MKALAIQQEQFTDEIGKQISRLGQEYDAKVLASSSELSDKLAAAAVEKQELETRVKVVETQLALTDEQHQQTLADVERRHEEQLSGLKQHHDQQLADLEVQHKHVIAEMEMQHEAEIAEMKKVHNQLTMEIGKLQQEASLQLQQLTASNAALECRTSPVTSDSDIQKNHTAELMKLEAEKSQIEKQLKASQDELQKLKIEKSSWVKTNKELRDDLEERVAGLQAKLEEADEKCEELVTREHDSMQREHALVVASLQEQLADKNKKDRTEVVASGQVCYHPVFNVCVCM